MDTHGASVMMRKNFLTFFFLALSLILADQAQGQMREEGTMRPYGVYCRGPKWGWYGAGKRVRTIQEVRALVTEFFRGTTATVGEVFESEHFFEVQVLDSGNKEVLDVLVIDKRNCRIRSKY